MITQVKEHFNEKTAAGAPARKTWFLEKFQDVEEVVYDFSAEDLNAAWLEKFTENKNPREDLAKLQKRISRMGTIRKAVLEQYIQSGEFMLDGIDFYRYSMVKNEFVADVLPETWNGKS